MRKKRNKYSLSRLYTVRASGRVDIFIMSAIVIVALIIGIICSTDFFYNSLWQFIGFGTAVFFGIFDLFPIRGYRKAIKLIKIIESEFSEEERANIEKMNEIDFRDYQ